MKIIWVLLAKKIDFEVLMVLIVGMFYIFRWAN